jgi:phospholipid/cholesterol/gamma-HCH transport system substrate-binding protein
METRANHIIIGSFALFVTACAFGFIYWIVSNGNVTNRAEVTYIFDGAILGLAKGSPVYFNGIKIGEVDTLGLDPDDPRRVRATAIVDADTPVREDTRTELGIQGLTGVAYIDMRGGSPDKPNILSTTQSAEIYARSSSIQDVLEGARGILQKVDRSVDTIDQLVQANAPALAQSLQNIERFTAALAANSDGIETALNDIATASRGVAKLTQDMEGVINRSEEILAAIEPETISSIMDDAAQIASRLEVASQRVDGLFAKVDAMLGTEDAEGLLVDARLAAKALRDMAETLQARSGPIADGLARFSTNGLRDVEALVNDGRQTLTRIDRVLGEFERNPQQLFFGNQNVPEYQSRRR